MTFQSLESLYASVGLQELKKNKIKNAGYLEQAIKRGKITKEVIF
jgi:hypothetical protein